MTGTTEIEDKFVDSSKRKSYESVKKDLSSIINKIDELNSFARALTLLRANSRRKSIGIRIHGKHLWILGFLLLWFFGQTTRKFISTYRYDKCLVEYPVVTQKIFRPPEDCSICRDIQHIDKLSNIDPIVFEERYAYSGRPVVIMDAMTNWTAPKIFSYSFFKSLYEGEQAGCQFFPYKTEFRSLQDVFNMSTSRSLLQAGTKPWYVGWSNCDGRIGTVLRQHYQRPYFLPLTAESEKTDWIFMGSHGYGAPMHVDDVEHPSWQAQIRGEKLWILQPPRECHYACKQLEVVVQTGEIIVLDTNRWYHQTRIVSEEMSITIGAEYD
ncbi:PREDICTED: uncharacterized protein LOC106790905 [Polistes canadensis]|uniref:uncharacterized protein LOC106790905 n=1 Tax=Polistes canadensis TaxID=91411 RepID=UPI000718ACA1|nr:PREDICTED: uncharacterized protein LOC106790905 [Polistes canadensis]KAI4483605.1 hypothetical protein M0804_007865 [Polistes exclamans]